MAYRRLCIIQYYHNAIRGVLLQDACGCRYNIVYYNYNHLKNYFSFNFEKLLKNDFERLEVYKKRLAT